MCCRTRSAEFATTRSARTDWRVWCAKPARNSGSRRTGPERASNRASSCSSASKARVNPAVCWGQTACPNWWSRPSASKCRTASSTVRWTLISVFWRPTAARNRTTRANALTNTTTTTTRCGCLSFRRTGSNWRLFRGRVCSSSGGSIQLATHLPWRSRSRTVTATRYFASPSARMARCLRRVRRINWLKYGGRPTLSWCALWSVTRRQCSLWFGARSAPTTSSALERTKTCWFGARTGT